MSKLNNINTFYFSNIIGKKRYYVLIYASLIASEVKHIFRYSLPTLFSLSYFGYLCSMTILPLVPLRGTNFYWFIDAFYIVRLVVSTYLIYIFFFFTFSFSMVFLLFLMRCTFLCRHIFFFTFLWLLHFVLFKMSSNCKIVKLAFQNVYVCVMCMYVCAQVCVHVCKCVNIYFSLCLSIIYFCICYELGL